MKDRSTILSRLRSSFDTRRAYISAKISTLVPSQIRALRMKSDMPRQADLARAAEMLQSRISMLETPGAANVTLDTLSRIAAAFKVGLIVKFVPFSEMLAWENSFSQDQFNVVKIDNDAMFSNPPQLAQAINLVPPMSYQSRTLETTIGGAAYDCEFLGTGTIPSFLLEASTTTVARYSQAN